MKTNSSSAPRNSSENHPPLARDLQGNLVAVPDGTSAFALKRETRGRPRLVIGADRQAVRFATDTTADDVEDIVGAGTFRVYALNEVGGMIDYVTTIVIGAEQDEAADSPTLPTSNPSSTRGSGSDLRFALETIRETNRVLAESLKCVAESQADWVKGLAVAKALPRNAPSWYAQQAVVTRHDDDSDDDDDDDDDDSGDDLSTAAAVNAQIQASTLGSMAKIADAFTAGVQTVKDIRNHFAGGKKVAGHSDAPPPPPRNAATSPSSTSTSSGSSVNPMIHLAEIGARLTKEERRFLNEVLRGEDGPPVTDELIKLSVSDAILLVRRASKRIRRDGPHSAHEPTPEIVADDPSGVEPTDVAPCVEVPPDVAAHGATDFMAHVMAVSAFLSAQERATVLSLFPQFAADRLEQLKLQLLRMSPEAAAAWIKANLEGLRAEVSS